MTDFVTYQPPGIYIDQQRTPLVGSIGSTSSVLAIVGPSVGYRVHTEAITLVATTAVTLAQTGVDQDEIEVRLSDGSVMIEDTDYTVTETGGADSDLGTVPDNETEIARIGGGAIADGATVTVTYQYTDTTYFDPVRVQDYDQVKDLFGEPFDPDSAAITSPLSLAAKLAFDNGANQMILLSSAGSASAVTAAQLQSAYAGLDTLFDVTIVVPLTVGITGTEGTPGDAITAGLDLKTYVEGGVNDDLYRIGLIGWETSVTTTPPTLAAGFESDRVMAVWPNAMLYFNQFTGASFSIGGYYLAAAAAGRMVALPASEPLTRKRVFGFSGIPSDVAATMTPSNKNTWGANGVTVVEIARDRRFRVRHGLNTDMSSVYTREPSIVRARDEMIRRIEDSLLASGVIGSAIVSDTVLRFKGLVSGSLEGSIDDDIILDYRNLFARQKSVDPSVIEAKWEYRPVFPANYFVLNFAINVDTGQTTATAA